MCPVHFCFPLFTHVGSIHCPLSSACLNSTLCSIPERLPVQLQTQSSVIIPLIISGISHFILLHFIAFWRFWVFYKLKFCKHFVPSISVGSIFPIAPAHFVSLYHILPILAVFQSFSLLLYLLWWSVISDLWCCYYNFGGQGVTPM